MHKKLNITIIIGAAFLLAATPALAERKPTTMGSDARVMHVNYNPTDVIRVHTHLRVNTAIELGNGERITQVLLGDSESFEVEVLSNRQTISIKPVIARASSNMTVYTNRRAIAFYVTEGSVQRQTFRVVVNFPDNKQRRTVAATGSRDTGYQFSGKARFRPVRVWNNGQNTFFEFRTDTRPSIFRVNASGYEVTTNTASKRRVVRVSGVHTEYSIRIGNEVICIRRIQGGKVSNQSTVAALAGKEF
ncbi:TrbG/VirB9 family P-type conjugative transfer protein [uncultured Aliiroseovarius sp.]|uniref:TrbG/VirB9 family P-type conjugative transfer protein n=1 Tax=uncultured Aliiroseovarius sp. TaxID=1658783 RepID=UPI002631FA24|nr:TrbG/VirB9 family P-type conjugative transfer protein [uncultured Aliiroseovarius sp.]